MKTGDPITMWPCSTSLRVDEVLRVLEWYAEIGENAAAYVNWSERHGEKETFISERWRIIVPNIFVVTSPKK